MSNKIVNVAIGVVLRNRSVFVCKRAIDAHQGGLWEFPGGKIESGEDESQALTRELSEEIGIAVVSSEPLITLRHDYADKSVCLYVRVVTDFTGEPHGKEGQLNEWRDSDSLSPDDFPAANVAIIDALQAHLKD